jgi:hypothetical protein
MWAAVLGYCERNPAEVERCASDLIELTTRHHFAHYMAAGAVYCGWARSVRAEPGGVEVRRSREKTRGHAGYRQRIKRQKRNRAEKETLLQGIWRVLLCLWIQLSVSRQKPKKLSCRK